MLPLAEVYLSWLAAGLVAANSTTLLAGLGFRYFVSYTSFELLLENLITPFSESRESFFLRESIQEVV
jgi:hypothetical protein